MEELQEHWVKGYLRPVPNCSANLLLVLASTTRDNEGTAETACPLLSSKWARAGSLGVVL